MYLNLVFAMDKLNSGQIHLQNSADFPVLGHHLCTRTWVHTMIGLLKKTLLICQSVWKEIWNVLPAICLVIWGTENKDLSPASQTLLTEI